MWRSQRICAAKNDAFMIRTLCGIADEVVSCSVRAENLVLPASLSPLVRYASRMCGEKSGAEKWISDKNIVIDAENKRYNIKKIVAESREKWEKALTINGMA